MRPVGTVIRFESNDGKVERVENTMECLSIELRLLFTRRNLFTLLRCYRSVLFLKKKKKQYWFTQQIAIEVKSDKRAFTVDRRLGKATTSEPHQSGVVNIGKKHFEIASGSNISIIPLNSRKPWREDDLRRPFVGSTRQVAAAYLLHIVYAPKWRYCISVTWTGPITRLLLLSYAADMRAHRKSPPNSNGPVRIKRTRLRAQQVKHRVRDEP